MSHTMTYDIICHVPNQSHMMSQRRVFIFFLKIFFLIFQEFGNRYVHRSDRSETVCLFCVLPPTPPRPGPAPFLRKSWKIRKIRKISAFHKISFYGKSWKIRKIKFFPVLEIWQSIFFSLFSKIFHNFVISWKAIFFLIFLKHIFQ